MNAVMACSLIYERLQRHRDDDDRLRIDALLDMPGARAALASHRHTTVSDMDIDVG